MFNKILIANRGEIACRVARTARRLGIATVAVYSEADRDALHVAACDEAYLLGPAPARESYLRADKILEIARASGAEAIHPGYGFLSENAGFASACAEAGIAFIGPPIRAIEAMGSKSESKQLMEQAGVPLVPGYHGDNQDAAFLKGEADRIGYPLLIKASAGGGGKGMRVVESGDAFDAALQGARREASSSFGDDKVLLERYLTAPRHVELQIFADSHGEVVHLFERDCSVQRRHQKVLEEAPAPGMDPSLRQRMGDAAIAAARAIGYLGAGTVEFLLDSDGSFYFMEMNTRLQVEHPVTEMITGQDLVEWQLRVAAGEPLPLSQEQLAINGHAFEARIYAENPDRDFLPAIGRLERLVQPTEDAHVRIDTGVTQGDEVSPHYDPMIAKLIVWDRDRVSALRRLDKALAEYRIAGLISNVDFLARLVSLPAFREARLDTGFIATHQSELFPPQGELPDEVLAVATLYRLLVLQRDAARRSQAGFDPGSPWGEASGWRMNQESFLQVFLRHGGESFQVVAHGTSRGFRIELPAGDQEYSGELLDDEELLVETAGRRFRTRVTCVGHELALTHQGRSWLFELNDPRSASLAGEGGEQGLCAPMPGSVIALQVEVGQQVSKGDVLMVVEAMKMEHSILAPYDGRVEAVHFKVGDQVSDGVSLLDLAKTGEA